MAEQYRNQYGSAINDSRRLQMEGERAFTWTEWRDTVVNHRSGRKASMSNALKGRLDALR